MPIPSRDPGFYLPHRSPFLMLDRIVAVDPGVSAAGLLRITADVPWSPVFLVEAMAQLAGVAAGHRQGEGGFLAAVDRAEFSGPLSPGDTVAVAVTILKSFGRLALVEGSASSGGEPVASALLTLGIGPLEGAA